MQKISIFSTKTTAVCLYNAQKYSVRKTLVSNLDSGKKRSDMPQYLEERLDREFFQFCNGLWSFSKTRKRTIIGLHKKYLDKPFFVIKSRRKMKKLLSQWRDEKAKHINPAL